jgi:RHS repeat-associated protein
LYHEKQPRTARRRPRSSGSRTWLRAEQLEERVLLDCTMLPMFLGDRMRSELLGLCSHMGPLPPPPSVDFQFAATANVLPQTAGHTRQTSVTLLGHTSPGLRVVLQQTGQGTTANASGNFSFSNVPLAAGSNVFRVTATDTMGQSGSAQHSITRDVNNLTEGAGFTSIFQFAFTVPKQAATVQFSYDSLKFDATGPFMPDAFEAALVDGQGKPLVLPIGGSHDAFFNITNGQSAALGANTRLAGTTVRVDLAHIPAGTRATLVVRLVSNDFGNSGRGTAPTSVRLDDLEVLPGSLNTPIGTTLAERLARQTVGGVDPSTLSDVTSSVHAGYGQTSYRPGGTLLFTDLTLRNTGTYSMDGPLVAVIEHLSDPTVHAENADGTTAQGQPYFLIEPAGQTLSPGQSTGSRQLEFLNPKQARFHYDLVVLGQVNQPPAFTSQPNTEAIPGVPYVYQAAASDADGDNPLHFSVLTGPAGMTVDATTGRVTWSPQPGDLGTHAVLVRVDDGRGGVAQQQFTITAIAAPPNRPPVFTSTPIVDANVNTPYSYQATATDPDGTKPTDPAGETLTYSVVSGPQGLSVNPATGLVAWTPTVAQLGISSVTLQVDDGRGGTATQVYTVAVRQVQGNLPPTIVSQPPSSVQLGQIYSYPVQAVDPDHDPLTYSLTTSPSGMAIDPKTGSINWDPLAADDSLRLSGQGYVITPNLTSFFPSSTVTLELWFNASGPGVLVDEVGPNALNTGFHDSQIEILSTGEVRARVWALQYVSLGFATFGTWHQVALRYDNSTLTLDGFLDGVKSATATTRSSRTTPTSQGYGQYYALGATDGNNLGSGAYFNGQIDEFRVWNTARTDSQITDNRNQPLTGTEPGLVAYYRFHDGTGPLAYDSSGHNNEGTLTAASPGGLPTWTIPIPDPQVTVRVDDGRGGVDTQSFTIHRAIGSEAGAIEGTKFNDLNANGIRDLVGGNLAPATLFNVLGTSDPYLAGMPAGATADGGDVAPAQSPFLVPGLTLTAGSSLMFTAFAGQVNNSGGPSGGGGNGPDGGGFVSHFAGGQNGISDVVAPINGLFGVFLGPDRPDATSAPPRLDFRDGGNVAGGLDYPTLAPVLKQLFYIGDGRTSKGDVQQIVVPAGATRLYLATMDTTQWNDNNGSFAVDVRPWSATPSIQPATLTPIATNFSGLIHVDYYEPDNTLIASLNYGNGQPHNFDEIKPDGSHVQFSSVSGFGDEVYIAIARSSDLGGFKPGDLFVGNGQDGQIARITNNGQTLINPWVSLPGSGHGLFRGYVTFDRTGVFGGDLIAETNNGEVWRVNAAGQATEVGNTHSFLEGAEVIPNDPARYGPLAGTILATDEQSSGFYTITPAGQVTFYDIHTGGLEDAHVIPANQNFFGADVGTGKVMGIRSSEFTSMVGDILFTQEFGGGLYRMFWDGKALEMQLLNYTPGSPTGVSWEGSQFTPAGVDPLPPVPLEPGLPGWTIYLDENHNGKLDPGEPSTITDSLGHYSFTNLAPGTYTVAEVGQPGWLQTAPGAGTQSVTVTAGQVVSGVDFGNTQKDVGAAPRPPHITSTAPAAGAVDQSYRYAPSVSNPDGRTLTFDLPVAPAGMAVDAVTGALVWTPTAAQAGPQRVLLRVMDDRGLVDIQDFSVNVLAADTLPIIASKPPAPALASLPYQYRVHAQDAEGETITFGLGAHPSGMAIDPASGLLTWTPDAALADTTQHVVVTAADPRGGTSQVFDLSVITPGANHPPVITSTPRTQIGLGNVYAYDAQASDPDNDPLSYHLDTAPAGMTIDATGLVQWAPGSKQFGPNQVTLHVDDGRGGTASQSFTITVVSHTTNQPPRIVSSPRTAGTVSHLFAYDVKAVDPDGDPVRFSLDQAPPGLSIDAATGTVRWLPLADQLGSNSVTVRVTDTFGASATQSFSVTVRSVDLPPLITSTPPTQAAVGQAYAYAVEALDPESDPLTYSLVTPAPAGMTIDAATGLVQWVPAAGQLGSNAVTLQVDDRQGGIATQSYTVVVSQTPPNPPPVITSTPPLQAAAGALYQYAVQAQDPDGDAIHFALRHAPAGMTISASGLVQWTPTLAELGTNSVGISAIDPAGGAANQDFTITVIRVNHPPVINSQPQLTTTASLVYHYDVQATDADGDPLSYALTGNAPAGMSIDSFGRLTWQTGQGDIGNHPITVAVSDNHGATVTQPFTLNVQADTQAPQVTLQFTENPANLGDTVTILASATDNVAVQTLNVTVGGTPLALDANGSGSLVVSQAGQFPVVATATDPSGNVGTATATLIVIDPHVTGAPNVAFTTPADGDVISAPTDVIGTASDPHLLFYTLEVAPVGSNNFTQIFRGTSSVTNAKLGAFDPSLLQNDSYVLRLTATNTGNITSSVDETVSVAGNLKLGNFTLSFQDLSLSLSGIPITVARTYDTLQANTSEDFGYGWRLEFRNVDLRTSLPPSGLEDAGIYTPFRDGSRVYVTLPGGKREGFTFHPTVQAVIEFFYHPNFVADPGVTDTLTVQDTPLTVDSNGNFTSFGSGDPYNPAAQEFGGQYSLTTKEGTIYRIDATNGQLLSVTDRNKNMLTFTDAGILSSTGPKVIFTRDAQNRITALTDPAGHQTQYQYDAEANLIAVTDSDQNVTKFLYRPDFPHYLDHLVDPLGRTGLRTNYNAQGQLVRLINAMGTAVQLAYDPTNSLETITDALGNKTTYAYDQQGNIVAVVDTLGGVTKRTYDQNNNKLSETDPLGLTTNFSYDQSGNMLSLTDARGNTTRYTYNSFNEVLTTTDPLGATVSYTYDARGNPLTQTDAAGNAAAYGYDSTGTRVSITDALGDSTHITYDNVDHITTQVNAQGNASIYTHDADGRQLTGSTSVSTPSGLRTLTTTWTYDAKGQVTSYTDADGHTSRYEYDAVGNQVASIDPLGHRIESRYNAQGQLVETLYADGTSDQYAYDVAGRLISQTDQAGRTTQYIFDGLGREIKTIYPDGTATQTEYDKDGRETAIIDQSGNKTLYSYDQAGNLTGETDALGGLVSSIYDAANRLVSRTDALGHTTQYVYDRAGHLTKERFADGTSSSTAYDALGHRTSQTDQAGLTTQYHYNAVGQLTGVIDALGQQTTYDYDQVGDMVKQTDANGKVTQFQYDGEGRRIATILPLGQKSISTYDGDGNIIGSTDFNGNTTQYKYDSMGRLTEETFPDSSAVRYSYTATGKKTTVAQVSSTGAVSATSYGYDSMYRLTSVTNPDGQTIAYAYDVNGNETSLTDSFGTTSYAYDALGRLQSVTDPKGSKTTYKYDAAGNLLQSDLANGVVETRGYDSLNRLISLEDAGPGGALIASYTYSLDPNGDQVAIAENDGSHQVQFAFTYDRLRRLTGETITGLSANPRTITCSYDSVGNRLTQNDSSIGLTTSTYDADSRLQSESTNGQTTVYAYDNNGNTVSVTTSTTQTVAHWDFQNRLLSADITSSAGNHHISYQYDGEGNRISETTDGQESRYLVDTNLVLPVTLEEYSPGGNPLVGYVYGTRLISEARAEATSFYLVDSLGGTRALTSAGGLVTERYTYSAFGQLISQQGTTPNTFLFAGQEFDPGLGQYYMRARYYDPAIGRFDSPDPAPGSLYRPVAFQDYVYAAANPVNFVDPTGLVVAGESGAPAEEAEDLEATADEKTLEAAAQPPVGALRATLRRIPQITNTPTPQPLPEPLPEPPFIAPTPQPGPLVDLLPPIPAFTPILYFGYQVPGHRQHIVDAENSVGDHPPDAYAEIYVGPKLTYRGPGNDWSRRWLKKALASRSDMVRDEFPFASAEEGGEKHFDQYGVSVRYEPNTESSRQGGYLRTFYPHAPVGPGNVFLVYQTAMGSGYSDVYGIFHFFPDDAELIPGNLVN